MIGLIGAAVGYVVGGKAAEYVQKCYREECERVGAQWAPDPMGEAVLRWWDGTRWTKSTLNSGRHVEAHYKKLLDERQSAATKKEDSK